MLNLKALTFFLSIYFHHVTSQNPNLVNFVCELAEKVVKADDNIKDITIGNFNSQMPPEFLDEVLQCISKHTMVIVTDFSIKIKSESLRKSQLVIIISDDVNQVSCYKKEEKVAIEK